MAMIPTNFLPGDPRLIDHIVYELKSQGIFDQFRKECIADVDTKPAYQNLSQRVEGSVMSFLERKKFSNNINKNQLREQLRKHITESGFLESGVERIVDQVVNPKINSVFLPKVEDVVYKYLGIEKPQIPTEQEEKDVKPKVEEDLLNTVSSELENGNSSQKTETIVEKNTNSDYIKLEEEEDESPDFESLEEENPKTLEENSVDSTFSGFSSAVGNQDISQNSMNSEENNYSTVNSEDDLKLINTNNKEIISLSEKSNSSAEDKPENEEYKKSDTVIEEAEKVEECKDEEDKHHNKYSYSEKSKYEDKDRRERRKSENSSSKDHRRDKSSSSKHSSSSSKDKRERINSSSRDEKNTRNDKKSKQSRERHRSRSEHEDRYLKEKSDRKIKDRRDNKSEKHRNKESRDKSGSSSRHHYSKDKESTDNKKSKEKSSSTSSSKYKSLKSSSEAADSKKSEKDKSSSHDDEKSTNNKDKKVNDDHYSFKDKNIDRRSTDRDSNDGSNSNKISRNNSFTDGKNTISDKESSENNFSGGGDSSTNNSDKPEVKTVLITHQNNNHVIKNDLFEQFHMNLHYNKNKDVPAVKCSKPKFAANIKEAMKIMKIRKQLAKLERDHQLTYLDTEPVGTNEKIDEHDDEDRLSQKTVPLDDKIKLCNGNIAANFTFSNNDEPCYYLENLLVSNYYLKKLNNYITLLEDYINNRITSNKTVKRKLLTENNFESHDDDDGIPARKRRLLISYRKLNNGHSRTSNLLAQEDFSLAENGKCIEIKRKDSSPPVKPKRLIKGASSKRYNTEDLYKPRPIINFTSSRRRNMNTSN